MRVGIAGFMHESNTFAAEQTTLRHFEEGFLHEGAALVPVWEAAHHEMGGFIAGCQETGVEMVPLLMAWATPHGIVCDAAYEQIMERLLTRIRAAGRLDGLLLALHGAMVSESHRSADSETLGRIRAGLGGVPIVLSLDMHANISPEMVALPDVTVVYRTYPHVDQRARGMECARLLYGMLQGRLHPMQAHVKLPLLIHIVQQYTGAGPMAEVFDEVARLCALPGVLSVSVAPGYIYADSPHLGTSVIVVTNGDLPRAEALAHGLGRFLFDKREALNTGLLDVASAVAEAKRMQGTVCLMDAGDNIGAGSPGNSVVIYTELMRQEVHPSCVVLHEPEAARQCFEAGLGGRVALTVGEGSGLGTYRLAGTVRTLSDGKFIEPEARHGGMRENDQGPTAVVETPQRDRVVLNTLRIMPTSLWQLLSVGIEPAQMKAIVVKGVTAPLAAYAPIAEAIVPVDSPGTSQAGPEAFTYHLRPRPLFPLEPVEMNPGDQEIM